MGLLIVNTGDGKGKSSSAFGMMARAWARDWHICVVQFVKSPKWKTGEQKLGEHLGVEWHTLGDGFTWESDDLEQTAHVNKEAWKLAKERVQSGEFDLVILDELTYLLHFQWLEEHEVVDALHKRPEKTHVVVTGRNAPTGLIDLADTVTEMRNIKHAFDAGHVAKRGLDY